jgi:hypothetical protein
MIFWAVVIALVLAVALLTPFLLKEMRKGQSQLKPGTPAGAGDVTPGRVNDPAPGAEEAQADPWSPSAHRP